MKRTPKLQQSPSNRRWSTTLRATLLLSLCLVFLTGALQAATVSGNVSQSSTVGLYPDGVLLYVKLVQNGTVLQVVQPNTSSGAYSFTGLSAGSYTIVVSDNNSTSDATPSNPLIYQFSNPSSGSRLVVLPLASSTVTGADFILSYQCSCGYSDGRLTTMTMPMTTNGDLSAWGPVTDDPDNNSCDSNPDRDLNSGGSSGGRNLYQFSYTFDSTNLYGLTFRAASDSNTDNFIYYADTNNNGIMESGEPVIYVGWQGSNRSVGVSIGTYQAASPGGDPLASGGLADGYTMPGGVNFKTNLYSRSYGSTSGTAMQWVVRWSDLFLANGTALTGPTAIRWHISSTNKTVTASNLASNIDDNMGGCGGCVASTQYGGVSLGSSSSIATNRGLTVYLPHTVTNTGNGTDNFTFTTTATGPWTPTITYYLDTNGNGVYDPGVDTLITNSGALASGASEKILIAVAIPGTAAAGSDTISFSATSTFIPSCGSGQGASASVTDSVRVGWILSGTVFGDSNHNGTIDTGETGTGQTIYAKLLSGSTLVATATVDPTTGAYTFPAELPAAYTVIVSNNNLATSLTPTYPAGWVATVPSTGSTAVTLSNADVANTNFGIFHGSSISAGVVFNDAGGPYPPSTPVATANNGVQDNAVYEAGIQSVTVRATDSTGNTVYDTATTDASGKFSLYIPSTATTLRIVKTPIANTQATGGTVGTTAGTYSRATETISNIVPVAGTAYTGVSFGSVPANTFTNDNTATLEAGTSTYYSHVFTAGTIGSVTFTTSAVLNPTGTAWTEAIYRDKNCTGVFDSVNDTVISGAQAITAPGTFCILVKETVPAGSSATNTVTVTATFTYTNASPALSTPYTHTDITTSGYTVSGTVYNDANHNSTKDTGEIGSGQTLYAKIVKVISGTPTVQAVTTVDTTTSGASSGTYSFATTPQPPGTYSIVLSTNNLTTDATPSFPTGWTGTQNPTGSIALTLGTSDSANNNFGLYLGSSISGTVFLDNGAGAGTANDGVKQSGETGLQTVTVTATNGATVYDTQVSSASGTFTLWIPSTATTVTVTRVATAGYMATGGSAGTTGGTYTRSLETVTLTNTSGTAYTGILFGDVPVNTLSNDNSGSVQQGTSIYYAHTFVAGSVGTVTFSTTAVSNPTLSGWVEAIYIDSNCNGQFDIGEPLATSQPVTPGTTICVLVKETSPATGTGQDTVTLQANMTYTNASPALSTTLTRQDVTSSATGPVIRIAKAVDKTQAYPGDTLTYTITYTNIGGFPARNMVITDSTPSSTKFVSATCGTPLPASLTACNVTAAPAVGGTGGVTWTFTGTLSPNGSGTVVFQVKVN